MPATHTVTYDQAAPVIREFLESQPNQTAKRMEINQALTAALGTNINQNAGLLRKAYIGKLIVDTGVRGEYRLVPAPNTTVSRIFNPKIESALKKIEQQVAQEFAEFTPEEFEAIQEKTRALRALLE